MLWRIEIQHKRGVFDSIAEGIQKSVIDLGISSVVKVETLQIYNLEGDLTSSQVKKIGRELLSDPITQKFVYFSSQDILSKNNNHQKKVPTLRSESRLQINSQSVGIEIAHNPGVMDPVEESTIKGIKDLGINAIASVRTAKKYLLHGDVSKKDLKRIIERVLSNKLIQHVVDEKERHVEFVQSQYTVEAQHAVPQHINLINVSDRQLMKLSQEGQLFLNLDEMKVIQKHFKRIKRNPTDCEIETIAQTWSEHCYHKTFRGNIQYTYTENGKTKTKIIRNLLKSTIVKATNEINKPWCVSVFHDNAGVIKFDNDSNICFKAETHNHPSALEPFGGANTGIGGVIRDILGTGLGAKPICNTDVFCFASPEMPFDKLPPGTLHPKRVMKGVVSGVRDYGNKMGIPTVNGSILFDNRFVGNPLVYCGCVGIMPKDKVFKKVYKGDLAVVVGGKTGRDGIHGATFSSGELTDESEVVSSGAVQIGDPIQEKKVLDALLKARNKNLYTAVTDCGAGGLSSAVGEMGEELGVRVDLEKVPLKYKGLTYEEIWISESQERMVFSVSPKNEEKFLKVFASENVEATVIGEFTGTKRLELFYEGRQVCDLEMDFLYERNPKITKEARWEQPKTRSPKIINLENLNDKLFDVMGHYNVCSKEWVVRQYDHEVQGGSVVKPFVGVNNDGPSDASVIAPKLGSKKGIAISNGINVRYGMIDPFWMAASCIDEALRQIVAVGGDIEKIAILDNFCWGNPDKPDRLGGLVRAAEGCYKAAVGYQVPFISGKDSLYNEYTENPDVSSKGVKKSGSRPKRRESIAIPGTLLISAVGIVNDVTKTVTMDFKKERNLIYCIGETFDELGGSIYLDTLGELGDSVPKVNMKQGVKIFTALTQAVKKKMIRSMHDCSEGGIGAALAEMAFSGGLGVTVRLDQVPYKGKSKRSDTILFSESNTRFLVEVNPKEQKKFEQVLKGVPSGLIGHVESTPEFVVYGVDQEICVKTYIEDLKECWQKPLRW